MNMTKKSHKYAIGDVAKFRFFDGGVRTGKIVDLTYMGDLTGDPHYNLPQYKIEVFEYNRDFPTFYTVSDTYIKEINGSLLDSYIGGPAKTKAKKKRKGNPTVVKAKNQVSELDQAIQNQKDFLRGNVTV